MNLGHGSSRRKLLASFSWTLGDHSASFQSLHLQIFWAPKPKAIHPISGSRHQAASNQN